ncbi:MAG: phosphatase PAP2 family protein [bacterium]|nr:phosphatase PAP2 family protein [bacterium]
MDSLMIFGASDLIYVIFFICLLLLIFGGVKEKKAFLIILIGLLIAKISIQIIHLIFLEPRPYITFNLVPLIKHIPDAAFPSQHTTLVSVVAFAYFFCKSKFTLLFVLTGLWVGFARIYVGVHYPLDILGGILVGALSVSLVLFFKKLLHLWAHR